MIKAVINVAAPRYHVYQVLTDYEKYKQWLPNCTGSVIASREGNRVDTDITVNMMKTVTMGLRFESDGAHSLTFSLLKSSDLKGYSGSYRLMDAADGVGTVVITEMDLDAGGMVPRFMVDRMAKKSIDDTGNALREYIKKLPLRPRRLRLRLAPLRLPNQLRWPRAPSGQGVCCACARPHPVIRFGTWAGSSRLRASPQACSRESRSSVERAESERQHLPWRSD